VLFIHAVSSLHRGFRLRYLAAAFAIALPLAAEAADGRIQLADARGASRTFMSLNQARSPAAAVHVVNPVRASGLHNDREGASKGFMRLDRNMLVINVRRPSAIVPVTRPVADPNTVSASSAISAHSNDPVMDLFGNPEDSASTLVFGKTLHNSNVRGQAWPVPASAKQYVSSLYGMRKNPFSGRPQFHGGIDIAAPVGTPVLASADGVVTEIGNKGGLGSAISVRHRDGSVSTYGHLSAQQVRMGQQVRQGQQIGKVGSTGRSTGPHLDYRIQKNGRRIDPMTILAQRPASVRLAQASIRR